VHNLHGLFAALLFLAVSTGPVRAETFQLLDGQTLTGEAVLPATEEGLNIRLGDNKYQRVSWMQFSQATLQELAKNPKLAKFAEPLLETPEEEKVKKTEVTINPVPRLERPAHPSILGGLLHSSVGLAILLLIYLANIYAAFEVSVVRAYPAAMVCGIAAIAPIIGPIVFLCLPTKLPSQTAEPVDETAAEPAVGAEPAAAPAGAQAGGVHLAATDASHASHEAVPEAQVFKRGQFTFNRRFIETKFAGFFGLVRREADKDMILVVKSARGHYEATRITRITGNEMHLEVQKGGASQEVPVPFTEIMEIILQHKDA
jgi:hypothetical protein